MGRHPQPPNGAGTKHRTQAKAERKARRASERRNKQGKSIVSREDSRLWHTFFLYAPEAMSIGTRLVVLSFAVKCMVSVFFK